MTNDEWIKRDREHAAKEHTRALKAWADHQISLCKTDKIVKYLFMSAVGIVGIAVLASILIALRIIPT